MTNREKLLAVAAGGVVVLYGAVSLVRGNIIEPLKAKRQLVTELRNRESMLRGRLATRPAVETNWRQALGRSIALDPGKAHLLFREDVHGMLTRSGLSVGAVQPRQARESKSGFREGFVELPLSINASGTLQQVVAFLREFYQKPYLARVESMGLSLESSSTAGPAKGGGKGAEDPRLNVNMQVTALVLPARFGPKEGPIPPKEGDVLLKPEQLAAFDQIHQTNLFRLEVPKVAAAPPVPDKPPATQPAELVKAPPPERPDADKLRLVAMNSNYPNLYVYIVDERKKTDPPKRYALNDPIDDGRLVMVHPRGMVVRVKNKNGSGHTDYFYPRGKSFKEREPLSPELHPAVVRELSSFLPEG